MTLAIETHHGLGHLLAPEMSRNVAERVDVMTKVLTMPARTSGDDDGDGGSVVSVATNERDRTSPFDATRVHPTLTFNQQTDTLRVANATHMTMTVSCYQEQS
jgi:hypothetical protein